MSEQGQPQFVVGYGGRLYRVQAVAELDSDDQQMLAMLDQAGEVGRAVMLPDLEVKSMAAPSAGANIGNDPAMEQPMAGANIGNDQMMSQPSTAANIGDDQDR
jgi:hypothetical protein